MGRRRTRARAKRRHIEAATWSHAAAPDLARDWCRVCGRAIDGVSAADVARKLTEHRLSEHGQLVRSDRWLLGS
jgi:hypothetical protein